ncbi:sulfurtransferase TusA family protein [Geminicoccus roseus]|uniref:sulfurtransferase TusA family protein n=1 Tax=Geminicoccus roseus TaxID=404900 RepID=UPI00040A1D8C|nr:sulfurtransferase TusA family protein [Geminicoccus roseus]
MSEAERQAATRQLDARHLACPLPVLRARKLLQGMAAGARLEVLATDPAARRDFPDFAETSGHLLLEASEPEPGLFRFLLERC